MAAKTCASFNGDRINGILVLLVLSVAAVMDVAAMEGEIEQLEARMTRLEDGVNQLVVTMDTQARYLEDAGDQLIILEGLDCGHQWWGYRCRENGVPLGRCLPSTLVCDGVPDCPAGDDETACDDIHNYLQPGQMVFAWRFFDTCTYSNKPKISCLVLGFLHDPISTNKMIQLDCTWSYRDGSVFRPPLVEGIWLRGSHSIVYPESESVGTGTELFWAFRPVTKGVCHVYTYRLLTGELCAHWLMM